MRAGDQRGHRAARRARAGARVGRLPGRQRHRLGAVRLRHPRHGAVRPGARARPATRALRPPHLAVAALLLRAAGRLDHRPADERRRRDLRRALAGPADARHQRGAAAGGDHRAVHQRLAAGAGRARGAAAGARPHALVPARARRAAQLEVRNRIAIVTAHLAESVAGMAVVQSFRRESRLPGALRRAQRRQPRGQRRRAADLVGVLPVDRVPRRRRHGRRAGGRRRRAARRARSARSPPPTSCCSWCSSRCRSCRTSTASCSRRPRRWSRSARCSTPRPTCARPSTRSTPAALDGEIRFDGVHFAYGAKRVLHGIDLVVPAGRLHRAGRRVRRRQVDDGQARGALLRPARGERARGRDRPARARPARLPAPARRRAPGPVPVLGHDRVQHPLRAPRRNRRRGPPTPPRCSGSTGSRAASPRASTTRCARAAAGSQPASAS